MANASSASAVAQSRTISRCVEKCSIGRGLTVLLGGADHELVNSHVPGPGHDEPDGLGDVTACSRVMLPKRCLIWSSTSGRLWPASSVSVTPGSITETRTCRVVTSWRSASLTAPTPYLVAL